MRPLMPPAGPAALRLLALVLACVVLAVAVLSGRWWVAAVAATTLTIELVLLLRPRFPLRIRHRRCKPLRIGAGGG